MSYNVSLPGELERRVKRQVAKLKRVNGGCSLKQATIQAMTAWVELQEKDQIGEAVSKLDGYVVFEAKACDLRNNKHNHQVPKLNFLPHD